MPITRRRRANPPDQPENNTNASAETTQNASATTENANTSTESVQPDTTSRVTDSASQPVVTPPVDRVENDVQLPSAAEVQTPAQSSFSPVARATNGERPERHAPERQNGERQETVIEGGRRTARGELFRRPPQVPAQATQPAPVAAPPLKPPSHEISLPLGNLLHLSYNPGYTGSEEARSQLLEQLAQESKKGGRARCWNCGSIAIVYDRWNTRSKTFGEVGVAICEICGVWSVM